MEDKKITMPAVALRGLTILPGMVQHFDISREKSVRAVETAMMGDQKVYLVTQRNPQQEVPTAADLYQMGTVSQIKQIVKMPNGILRVMVGIRESGSSHTVRRRTVSGGGDRGRSDAGGAALGYREGSDEPDR